MSISEEGRKKIAGSYGMTTEHPRLDDSDAKLWFPENYTPLRPAPVENHRLD